MNGINNIIISQGQKKAKPKRGNCTVGGAIPMSHKGACPYHGGINFSQNLLFRRPYTPALAFETWNSNFQQQPTKSTLAAL
jgi:hypothetical protein